MALLLLVAACGGGSGDDTGDTVAADDSPKATLGIITTEIETALGDAAFTEATEGQQLDVGDRVRTDTTGFAEITYHDGSWQRVEAEATLTILALSADASVNAVRTGHDIGRTWNNVQELDDPDDTYEVRTPVATAAVRGTRFATDCPTDTNCTFTVLDGTVRITPTTGDPVTLTAGRALTITDQGPDGDPVDADTTDPWITKNQDLDTQRNGDVEDGPADDDTGGELTLAACDAFSAEEATVLANAREDGRASGGMRETDAVTPDQCTYVAADAPPDIEAGIVQVQLDEVGSFEECAARYVSKVTSSGEPLEGVGDEAAWYADERTVLAVQDGICLALSHDYSDAGQGSRRSFADAAQRILTRVTSPTPPTEPGRNMTVG